MMPMRLAGEVMAYARDRLEPDMKGVAPEAGSPSTRCRNFPGSRRRPRSTSSRWPRCWRHATATARSPTGPRPGLFAQAGIPTVVIGPGSIEQAHKADEFIAASELDACGEFIDRLIAHCRT